MKIACVSAFFCKYGHNNIENDYRGGKLGFVMSRLELVGSVASVALELGLETYLGYG